MYVYIYIYTCIYLSLSIYIYIYIYILNIGVGEACSFRQTTQGTGDRCRRYPRLFGHIADRYSHDARPAVA